MGITVQTRKRLWGLSGNQCAFPGCTQSLGLEEERDKVIGHECHIEGQGNSGPRHNPNLSSIAVDDYSNLILLCPTHHTIIDGDEDTYTVEKLQEMKNNHESRVRKALNNSDSDEFETLFYESVVFTIADMLNFDHWAAWTSYLASFCSPPQLVWGMGDQIDKVINFIRTRIWINKYEELESAIQNLLNILIDLNEVFFLHSESHGDVYRTEKFYKTKPYDRKYADETLPLYKKHCSLVINLTYEMTRACNKICDLYRKLIDKSYRMEEGKLNCNDHILEYRLNESLYPGLKDFDCIAKTRDQYVNIQ